MDAIPPPQSQATQQQKDCNMDPFPSAAAAVKAPIQADSPHQNPILIQPMNNNIPVVDPSALITPIKVNEQQLKARKKQLQLQLAIVNHKSDDTPAPSGKESQRSKAETGGSSSAKPLKWPPVSSSKSLAPLAGRMADLMTTRGEKKGWGKRNTIEFEVNQECTSIALVPSGNLAIAGFTDGTLRLFDLTGTFVRDKNDPRGNPTTKDSYEFDDDASSSEEEMEIPSKGKRGSNEEVCSRVHQRFGVVACQIHARGVHTSLLMDVAVSEDGLYAFGGVMRGSVELAAVYLGDAENYLNERFASPKTEEESAVGLLDLVRVDRHADAKLKGFGAVARLWNGWERSRSGERPEYLLFTGKGIKNIHIWSFQPSCFKNGEEQEAIWTCLYDTQTNGTSISQLYFRHNANGLQGISKSDDQKLRVWDLSWEQKRVAEGSDGSDRPKRPNYVDVASTENTVGVCGSYAFALSAASEAIINLIPLDAEDVSSPFNVTELALPMNDGGLDHAAANRPFRSGRQQRGELKSVVNVCGLVFDASHALLNLSDGSMVQYLHDESGHPVLVPCSTALSKTSIDPDVCPSFPTPLASSKKMCLARVGSQGTVVVAVSSYNEPAGRGALMFRALPVSNSDVQASKGRKFWGFNGLKKRHKPSVSLVARKKPQSETKAISSPSVDDITTLHSTPMPETNIDNRKPAATTVMPTPAAIYSKGARNKIEANIMVAPSPIDANPLQHTAILKAKFPGSVKKSSKTGRSSREESISTLKQNSRTNDMTTPTMLQTDANACNESPVKRVANKKFRGEQGVMDSQLESLVHQSSKAAANTPAKGKELIEPPTKKQKVSVASTSEPTSRRESAASTGTPIPSSPRRSSRKARTPIKTAAPSDNNKTHEIEHISQASIEQNALQHLGVTIFEKKQVPELPESCFHPKLRAKLLREQLSPDTVAARTVTFDLADSPSKKSEPINPTLIKQDEERRNLAAKHRAEHEMIRRQVLNTIRYVISTWDIELNSSRSYGAVVESAKKWFDDALADHQVTLNDMMERQMMEAESLSARQTLQLKRSVPMLQVSFPFPQVFEQAKHELHSHFGF